MTKYKLKWVDVIYSEKFKRDVLIVPLVWRWVDWKFDKFISPNEALDIISDAVIDPTEKTSVMSNKDKAKYGSQSLF